MTANGTWKKFQAGQVVWSAARIESEGGRFQVASFVMADHCELPPHCWTFVKSRVLGVEVRFQLQIEALHDTRQEAVKWLVGKIEDRLKKAKQELDEAQGIHAMAQQFATQYGGA